MNLELFIARRIASKAAHKSSASSTILKIATVAIALGMVVMLIAIATGFGLKREIRQKVAAFTGDIYITGFDGNSSLESVSPISVTQDFYPNFSSVPEVVHIQGVAARSGIIRTEKDFEGVVVKGVGADYDWARISDYLVAGVFPDFTSALKNDVLVSTYIANRLGFSVGDDVFVNFVKPDSGKVIPRKLTIVGLYESAYQEYDKSYIITDIRHIQRINKWKNGEVGGFEVFVNDFDDVQAINNKVYEKTGSFLQSTTVKERNFTIFEWIKIFDFNIALIIVVMLVVGGINIVVALIVLILERTRMIGVLKALGGDSKRIFKIFLYTSASLVGKGMFWGNVIGIGLLVCQYYFGVITLNPETYYVKEAPVQFDLLAFFLLNLGVFLVCLLLLLLPSYLITKVSPARSMRFD